MRSLLDKGDENLSIGQAVPYLEGANSNTHSYATASDFSTIKRPRAIKSHVPYISMSSGLPKDTPGKYIYVPHNPKDTTAI